MKELIHGPYLLFRLELEKRLISILVIWKINSLLTLSLTKKRFVWFPNLWKKWLFFFYDLWRHTVEFNILKLSWWDILSKLRRISYFCRSRNNIFRKNIFKYLLVQEKGSWWTTIWVHLETCINKKFHVLRKTRLKWNFGPLTIRLHLKNIMTVKRGSFM